MSRPTWQCKVFVTVDSMSVLADAMAVARRIEERLKAWMQSERIVGYDVVAIGTPADYETYDLDDELITGATGGALPAVYLNVTYDRATDDRPALDADDPFVRECHLVHLQTYPD